MRALAPIMMGVALLWNNSSAAYERAVSLAPHITELVYAINAQASLVATVDRSDYPPAALALPRVGDGISFSAEHILTMRPDVILAWQPSPALAALEKQLAHQAIPVHYLNPQSLEDIGHLAQQLGVLLNQEASATTFAQQWQQQLQTLKARYATSTPITLFIALHSKPFYSLNDPIVNDVLQTCGAKNWLPATSIKAPNINVEQLLNSPTDGLIYSHWDTELAQTHRLLSQAYGRDLPRFQVNEDHFYRAGPRLLLATHQLCQALDSSKKSLFSG